MKKRRPAVEHWLRTPARLKARMVVARPEQNVPRSRRRDLVEYDGVVYEVEYDSERGGYFIVDNDGYERDVVLDEHLGEFHVDDHRYDDNNEEGDQ